MIRLKQRYPNYFSLCCKEKKDFPNLPMRVILTFHLSCVTDNIFLSFIYSHAYINNILLKWCCMAHIKDFIFKGILELLYVWQFTYYADLWLNSTTGELPLIKRRSWCRCCQAILHIKRLNIKTCKYQIFTRCQEYTQKCELIIFQFFLLV